MSSVRPDDLDRRVQELRDKAVAEGCDCAVQFIVTIDSRGGYQESITIKHQDNCNWRPG